MCLTLRETKGSISRWTLFCAMLLAFTFTASAQGSGSPALLYGTYLGGSQDDAPAAVALDNNGFAYLVGTTVSDDFPATFGSHVPVENVPQVFVTKVNTRVTGAASLVWSTYLGRGEGRDIALDAEGNIYVTGVVAGTAGFPTTTSAYSTACDGLKGFLSRLGPDGALLYSTCFGGTGSHEVYTLAVAPAGIAYVGGHTTSTDFSVTAGAYQEIPPAGSSRTFITKFDTEASGAASLLYGTYFGGAGIVLNEIAADEAGNVYLTGETTLTTFPVTPGGFQTSLAVNGAGEGQDSFVTRLDTTKSGGAALIYSSYLGGRFSDQTAVGAEGGNYTGGIATDGKGTVYLTGVTNAFDFPTTADAYRRTYGGGTFDSYVACIDTNTAGSASLLYSTYLGGSGLDMGFGVDVTPFGTVHVTGMTESTNFPAVSPIVSSKPSPTAAYVARLDTMMAGSASLVFSSYLGVGSVQIGGIAINSVGEVALAANLSDSYTPTLVNGFQSTLNGFYADGFLAGYRFEADVSLSASVDYPVTFNNEPIRVTTTIANNGPGAAAGVVAVLAVPDTLAYSGYYTLNPSGLGCGYNAPLVVCAIGRIDSGASVQMMIQLHTGDGALPRARVIPVSAVTFEHDPSPADNAIEPSVQMVEWTAFVPQLSSPASGSPVSDTTPQLSWPDPPGSGAYELQLSRVDPAAGGVGIINTTQLSYTPTLPLLYDTYYWRVRVVINGTVRTQWSETRTFTVTAPGDAVPSPNLVEATPTRLMWNRVTWAAGYHLQVSRTPDFSGELLINSRGLGAHVLSFTLNLSADGVYYWRVCALDAFDHCGGWSPTQSFVVDLP